MKTNTLVLYHADSVARTLAEQEIDPNEVAKTFTHLRTFLHQSESSEHAQQQAVKQWWKWLETISGPGARAVVRSGRTIGYYKAILAICRQHLRSLEPQQLSLALGWSVRLMRYYGSEGALSKPSPFGGEGAASMPQATQRSGRAQPQPDAPRPRQAEVPKQPAVSARLPAVGERFRGQISDIDDDLNIVILELPASFQDANGATIPISAELREETLVVIPPQHKTGGGYKVGNPRWVEVVKVLKEGKLLEVKPIKAPGKR